MDPLTQLLLNRPAQSPLPATPPVPETGNQLPPPASPIPTKSTKGPSNMNSADKVAHLRSQGHSERDATIKTIKPKEKGQKKISFHEGGLHASTGTPAGKPISAAKHEEAKEGKLGPKAKQQETFFENVLSKGHK